MSSDVAAVVTLPANVDVVLAVSIVLVGAATLLLAYLLVSCRCSQLGVEVTADSAMDEASGAKEELGVSTSHGLGTERSASLAASSPGSSTAQVGASSSSSRDGLFRRPLAHSQRHDSSSTLPMSSSMRATSVASSFADSASLPSARRTSSTWSTFTTQQPLEEPELACRSPPPHVSRGSPQQQQLAQDSTQVGASGNSPTLQQQSPDNAGRLFVPTWGLPPPRPLQAVSAPLTGLVLSSSGSQGDQLLPSVQSLSDPTVSAVRTPIKPPAQLPAAALLQEASQAASQQQGGTRTGLGAASSRPVSSAAGMRGVGAAGTTRNSSFSEGQQHVSATAPSLDLASVLTPDAAGSNAALARRLLPPGAAAGAGYSSTVSLPHVRPIGTCLPAAPWSGAAAGLGADASNLLYNAAPPRPLPTNSLYKSPLQHVTLSVKVPTQFTPTAASNLQSLVAHHVWAGETRLKGATGELRDPQHTIMHMVSIPGCIQLFLTVTHWHPEQDPATAVPQAAPGWGLESMQQHLGTGQQDSAAADMQAGSETAAWFQAGEGVLTGAPAPAWLVEAVCKAVEEFCRAPPPEASTATAPSSDSSGAGQQDESSAQQQHYTGPVLLNVNGVMHTLKPDAANPGAAWVLQECSAQELAGLQAGPHFTAAPTAAAAAAHAIHPPVVWQASRGPAPAVAGLAAAPVPTSPVPETPAMSAVHPGVQSSLTQLQQSGRSSSEGTPPVRSASPTPAAARTFIRTVARGVVSMHDHGNAGLLEQPDDVGACTTSSPAAAGSAGAATMGANAAGIGTEAPLLVSSRSLAQAAPVLSLTTSCAPATALPPGMWAWPLYLATTGQGAATADARITVRGSSAAVPWVSLHGLPGRSCRVVLASSAGAVLMDNRITLENGVARFLAPESSTVQTAKIFYMLPPASASGTTGPSTPTPAPSTGSASATGSAAAPADQLLCMLPLLYLPPDAVIELCEAARALMLERSNYLFTQQLQQQREEREREQAQLQGMSGSTMGEESYAVGLGLSGDAHIGTLSMTGAAVGAGDLFSAGLQPEASATDRAEVGLSAPSAAAAAHLGTPAERNQAGAGASSHEGSFDTQSTSSASQPPQVQGAGTDSLSGVTASDPVASAAAADQALAAASGRNYESTRLPRQHTSSRLGSSENTRSSSESAVTAGNGSSGSSSIFDSKTGLEDEPGQLNLRGRLFEGATDVHQLLNSQYLSILADLGLLIELAPEAPAGIASNIGSGSGVGAGADLAAQHVSMATEVGQQLLVWFIDNRCWNCCQLVLQLLVRLGVNLHVHGQPVTSASITSAAAVQHLMQSAAAAGAATPGAAHAAAVSMLPIPQADMIVPTPISGISRAGVWGHLPPEFPAAAMQSPQKQLGQSRVSFARQPSAESPHFGFVRPGVGSSSGAGSAHAGHADAGGLGTTLPAVRTAPHVHHAHTSSTSTSASYHSLSSAGSAAEPPPEESESPAPQALRVPKAPIVWPPYKPTVFTPTAAATAAARVEVEQQFEVGGIAASEGEGQPSAHGSRGSLRLSGMLDSASEMWTRLRRNRSKGKREGQQ